MMLHTSQATLNRRALMPFGDGAVCLQVLSELHALLRQREEDAAHRRQLWHRLAKAYVTNFTLIPAKVWPRPCNLQSTPWTIC